MADLLTDRQRPDNLFGLSFSYSQVFSQYRLYSSCPAVKQIAAFSEAQVYRLQHGQEGSAGEERFASPLEMGQWV